MFSCGPVHGCPRHCGMVRVRRATCGRYCFYEMAEKGPWFKDLQDFVQHYNSKPYDLEDDHHILKQPFDPVTKRASMVDETMIENTFQDTAGILPGEGEGPWYKKPLLWYCFAIFVYFLVGTCYYVEVEGWTIDEAIYFAVIVATTVGYGDNPSITTHGGMLFTTFYVLFGVAMVLSIVGKVYAVFLKQAADFAMKQKKDLIKALVTKDNKDALASIEAGPSEPPAPVETKAGNSGCCQTTRMDDGSLPLWHRALHAAITKATAYLVLVAFVGMMFMSYHKNVAGPNEETTMELVANGTEVGGTTEAPSMQAVVREVYGNFDFVEALYWVVITGTTVGFGDYSAQHPDSRWFLIFYLWFIVIAMGNFLTALQNAVFASKSVTDIFKIKLDEDLIRKIDDSGDGKISRIEWTQAMLKILDIADADILDLINKQFDHLNADGDEFLTTDDIKKLKKMTKEEKQEYDRETADIIMQGEAFVDKQEQEHQRQQGFKTGAGRQMQGL